MARVSQKSLFLERRSYRQRRLRDVARMLPVIGLFLWLLPLAWRSEEGGTGSTLIFIFVIWIFLIALAAVVAAKLSPEAASGHEPPS